MYCKETTRITKTFKVEKFLHFCFSIFDFFAKLSVKTKYKYDILLIRLDAIGDFVIWTDTIRAYKELYSNQKIAILCQQSVKEIAEKLDGISLVFPLENHIQKRIWYRWKFIRNLRKYKFTKVISSTYMRIPHKGAELAVKWANTEEIIGFDADPAYIPKAVQKKADKKYTKIIPSKRAWQHELLQHQEFIRGLGLAHFEADLPNLPFIKKTNLINTPYCVITLGAGTLKRAWSVENFAELAQIIPSDLTIVLNGHSSENYLAEYFEKLIDKSKVVLNLVGNLSLWESFELIKGAEFTINNESSSAHISIALQIPGIIFCGGGHWKRFVPYPENLLSSFRIKTVNKMMDCYYCNWQCKYPLVNGKWKCVAEIEVENAKEALRDILNTQNNKTI